MNAETLGALATIVNEAIAKAVQPLQQRIAELEGRPVHEPFNSKQLWDGLTELSKGETETRELVLSLQKQLTAPAVTPEQFEEFRKAFSEQSERVKLLAGPPPAYDDSELRQELARVSKMAATVYNDHPVLQRLDALEARKEYDDQPLRQWVTEQLKALPEPTVTHGTDGKDALALEVLPEIDQAKSYVRNTYAKHNGGLWRSFEQTHGMRGWEVIVDGVHAVMPMLEGKSLTVRVIQSSGTESVLMADLPIQEYKGVFRPEAEYTAHDTATWAGSLWHCNVTGTKAKPGDGSSDWTLAVKKGRDAKEVVRV